MAQYTTYPEQRVGGVAYGCIEVRLDFSDLSAAATSATYAIQNFPATAYPLQVLYNLETYFTGGSATAATIEVGDAANDDELLEALNVFDTTTKAAWAAGVPGNAAEFTATGSDPGPQLESAYAPLVSLKTTTDDTENLTAGAIFLQVHYRRMVSAA